MDETRPAPPATVAVSFAPADAPAVAALQRELRARGLRVWPDLADPAVCRAPALAEWAAMLDSRTADRALVLRSGLAAVLDARRQRAGAGAGAPPRLCLRTFAHAPAGPLDLDLDWTPFFPDESYT